MKSIFPPLSYPYDLIAAAMGIGGGGCGMVWCSADRVGPLRAQNGVVAAKVCARNAAMCDEDGCKWCVGDIGRQAQLHRFQKRGRVGEVACGGGGLGEVWHLDLDGCSMCK